MDEETNFVAGKGGEVETGSTGRQQRYRYEFSRRYSVGQPASWKIGDQGRDAEYAHQRPYLGIVEAQGICYRYVVHLLQERQEKNNAARETQDDHDYPMSDRRFYFLPLDVPARTDVPMKLQISRSA